MMRLTKNSLDKIKASSLIEVLVYIAIFMMVSTASVTLILSLDDFIDQYRLETMLYRSGSNVLEPILLAIRQADDVDLLNTVLLTPATGRLTVENVASTTSFTLNAGELGMVVDGTDYGSLTADDVVVDSFTVYHYPLANSEFVRVKLVLTATLNPSVTKTVTLYGGSVIRGSI